MAVDFVGIDAPAGDTQALSPEIRLMMVAGGDKRYALIFATTEVGGEVLWCRGRAQWSIISFINHHAWRAIKWPAHYRPARRLAFVPLYHPKAASVMPSATGKIASDRRQAAIKVLTRAQPRALPPSSSVRCR